MKYKIIFSIALVLSIVLISLMSSDSTAQAQRNRSFLYDSGVVRPGPDQMLIGLLVPSGFQDNQATNVRSRKMQYSQDSCSGSLCKHSVASETVSDPVSLAIGEGMSDTVALAPTSSGARIVFESNNPNLQVIGQVVDVETGAVLSSYSFGCGAC